MAAETNIPAGRSRECVLLLSGGLDSTTLLAALKEKQWNVDALTFRYGQKHQFEIQAAENIAATYTCRRHLVFDIPLSTVAESALTSDAVAVPRGNREGGIPATYVPARNMVFLSIAVSWAESLGLDDIFIAVNSVDFSGYPDCREEFIQSFEKAARKGTKIGTEKNKMTIHAPFIHMSKKQIIRLGISLGVNYALTHTCYNPDEDGRACGACDACLLRLKGFRDAGSSDPAVYMKSEAK